MSKKMMKMTTPEEVLNSVREGINAGDLDALITLYETDACFATQPGGGGHLAKVQKLYAKA